MGLVLTLLPIEGGDSGPDFAISHSALRVGDEDCGKFDDLLKLESDNGEPVPKTFNTYLSRDGGGGVAPGEAHYGNTQTTPYGEKLRCLRARILQAIGFSGPVGAYVDKCPPEQRVALFWS